MNTLQRVATVVGTRTGLPGPTIWRIGRQLDLAGEKVVRLHHREYRIIRRGNARGAFPPVHVAHESRAATIAPCCAACWMVE